MKKERRDMSDKELDEFFNRKAQNPEILFQQEDWELMKRKLEGTSLTGKEKTLGKGSNGWLLALISLVLLIGLVLVWNYWIRNNETSMEESMSAVKEVVTREAQANQETIKKQAGKQESESAAGQTKPDEQTNPKVFSDNGWPAKSSPKFNDAAPGDSFNKVEIPKGKSKEELKSLNKAGISARGKRFDGQFAHQLPQIMELTDAIIGKSSIHETIKDPAAHKPEEKKEGFGFKKFSLSLSIAPDVSALRISDIVGLGNSLGLNLEYFIQPNLSLNAGALYAFKTYQGQGGDYPGYAAGISGMLGDCWMLDLPLNIRYYPINKDLSRWYISAGASSYLMLKEKYDLEITSSSGKPYDRRVEVRNGKRHYFSVVNLSLGYERVLTDKIAIQVEPYLKLPLNGIGEGGIKLKSAGALIGLKYKW